MTNDNSSLKSLRMLEVSFQTFLQPWELSKFRGAMAHKVGLENDWFHNHNNEDEQKEESYHYRYPLIQYKLHRKRPLLLCIDRGVDEAHHFFTQSDWSLKIGAKQHDMHIHHLHLQEYNLHYWEQPKLYRLHNWLALNSENYRAMKACRGLRERLELLERILRNHILKFYGAMGVHLEEKLEVYITDPLDLKRVSYKGIKKEAYTLDFETNVFLPNFIGLGQGSSVGFGVVKPYR